MGKEGLRHQIQWRQTLNHRTGRSAQASGFARQAGEGTAGLFARQHRFTASSKGKGVSIQYVARIRPSWMA
ncbi:hypothetical protein, partial [Acidovorax sp.]|uniref:hypothetical protein n=1 Tax=Acidovorax sp. TaxID=1872122 RepID=UPI002ACD9373